MVFLSLSGWRHTTGCATTLSARLRRPISRFQDSAVRAADRLRVPVSKLRKALGEADRVVTSSWEYAPAQVGADECDSDVFERLAADGIEPFGTDHPRSCVSNLFFVDERPRRTGNRCGGARPRALPGRMAPRRADRGRRRLPGPGTARVPGLANVLRGWQLLLRRRPRRVRHVRAAGAGGELTRVRDRIDRARRRARHGARLHHRSHGRSLEAVPLRRGARADRRSGRPLHDCLDLPRQPPDRDAQRPARAALRPGDVQRLQPRRHGARRGAAPRPARLPAHVCGIPLPRPRPRGIRPRRAALGRSRSCGG